MDRRYFISQLSAGLASCAVASPALNIKPTYDDHILDPEAPKAIAMWDFSWLLRHYRGGGFEDWDKALDELVYRGYNALRIDCFPQFIGQDDEGNADEHFHLPKNGWHPTLWGNQYTINIEPHASLLTFIKKCSERSISLVLSSWFYGHGTQRNKKFTTAGGLIRAWDQTLQLLANNDLLDTVLYVDILNEYPLWHGYQWLIDELSARGNSKKGTFDFLNLSGVRQYNDQQILYYNDFINKVIGSLKKKWPDLRFMTSQTNTLNTPWQDLDISQFDVLDIHQWMVYNQSFSQYTGYFSNVHTLKNDIQFKKTYRLMNEYWSSHTSELIKWLATSIIERRQVAIERNIPLGCTEGWGSVIWMNHPDLDWTFIKEVGLIAATLGTENQYSFNCSSNFTHPHFTLWEDITWHKEVTSIIRKL